MWVLCVDQDICVSKVTMYEAVIVELNNGGPDFANEHLFRKVRREVISVKFDKVRAQLFHYDHVPATWHALMS